MHSFTDFLRIVSYPAWDDGKSSWQEISRLRFAALEMTGEGKTIVYHCGRKLFANGFLLDVGQWGFKATGNCLRMVSYSTWEMGIHSDGKLFAYSFLSGMGRLHIIATGNY